MQSGAASCAPSSVSGGEASLQLTHVAKGSTDGGGDAVQVRLGEAEVCELDDGALFVAPQQHILQLDVPVGHAHAVAVVDRQDELLEDPSRLSLLQNRPQLRTPVKPLQHAVLLNCPEKIHFPCCLLICCLTAPASTPGSGLALISIQKLGPVPFRCGSAEIADTHWSLQGSCRGADSPGGPLRL